MCANVIQRNGEPVGAQRGDLAQQRVRMRQQAALGEFEHQLELAMPALEDLELGAPATCGGRLTVDAQQRLAAQPTS